ncbi:LacI family DNA-binding transcriptional regulator [Arthrobacter gyeryongensis]|uniref:LacI family DNA-binding transcriptional regulator n=1 Tax=Arthrobacter gyeryongensis TaxID=1650592 RepID=A0ABP9SSQ2_9MICC
MSAEEESASLAPQIQNSPNTATSKVTIYDIAHAAGVNASTVSRALGKKGRTAPRTQKLIEDIATELGYRVNPFARALPTGRTYLLGLIVGNVVDPSFLDVIRCAESTATAHGYNLILVGTPEAPEKEIATIQRIKGGVDGLILADPLMCDDQLREMSRDTPLVVIDRQTEGIPCVVPDVKKGVREAIRGLRENGHRKVAFVSGARDSWMSTRIGAEVQDACEWSGMEAIGIPSREPTVEGGRLTARNVVASGATAVLTCNDLLAIGLMQELQAASITVPDRMSIVGFGDAVGSVYTTPQLTTVRWNRGQTGTNAINLLVEILDASGTPARAVHLDTEVVIRGSIGRQNNAPSWLEVEAHD